MTSEADQDLELEQYNKDVQDIVKKDQAAFDLWSADSNKDTSTIPKNVLRYLIPPQLLAQAENPAEVDIAVRSNDSSTLDFYVVQHNSNVNPETDYFLVGNAEDVEDGILQSNDLVYMKSSLLRLNQTHTYDAIYDDNEAIRGRGITREYYRRLRSVCEALGNEYISSEHFPQKMNYFTEQIGRVPLGSLDKNVQTRIVNDITSRQGALVTDESGVVVQVLGAKTATNLS